MAIRAMYPLLGFKVLILILFNVNFNFGSPQGWLRHWKNPASKSTGISIKTKSMAAKIASSDISAQTAAPMSKTPTTSSANPLSAATIPTPESGVSGVPIH